MKMHVYSIYDTATGAFMRPFYQVSDGQALRSFGDVINDETNDLSRHPEHYSVFRLATWNDQDGLYIPEKAPERLQTGLEAKKTNGQAEPPELTDYQKHMVNNQE